MSNRPTKVAVLQQREDVIKALAQLRGTLPFTRDQAAAFRELETFVAIACRVMAKTNISKLAEETRTVEIAARLSGRVVFSPD